MATTRRKLSGEAGDPGLVGDGIERGDLVFGGEYRTADQPPEVRQFIEQGLEARKFGADRVDGIGFFGKFEERGGIAPRRARYCALCRRHGPSSTRARVLARPQPLAQAFEFFGLSRPLDTCGPLDPRAAGGGYHKVSGFATGSGAQMGASRN